MSFQLNELSLIIAPLQGGWTPLHLAARCGHFCIVKELVEEMNVNIISTTAVGLKLVYQLLHPFNQGLAQLAMFSLSPHQTYINFIEF